MQISAATDRAKDLEIQKLRADVAELVRGMRELVEAFEIDPGDLDYVEYDAICSAADASARRLIKKHGGQ